MHIPRTAVVVCSLLALTCFAGEHAFASILVSKAPIAGGQRRSNTPKGTGSTDQHADDFTLAADSTITTVEWFGYYEIGVNPSPFDEDFLIRIYQDAGGVLGDFVAERNVQARGITDTGLLGNPAFGVRNIFSYSSDVAPLALSSGSYFIAIVEDDADTNTWIWANASLTSAPLAGLGLLGDDLDPANWFDVGPGDQAFTLHGTTGNVPEPSTFVIWSLLAVAISCGRVWQRRLHIG